MTRTITVEGMSCGHCEQSVEDALVELEGVTGATADREAGTAMVEGDAPAEALVSAIEDAGYDAEA